VALRAGGRSPTHRLAGRSITCCLTRRVLRWTRPLARSIAMVRSLSPSTAVRKIRSSPTDGEELPGGRAVFQTTLVLGPNSTGRPASSEIPAAFGPRNCGHSQPASRPATRRPQPSLVVRGQVWRVIQREG
jgi:hypothetical protein